METLEVGSPKRKNSPLKQDLPFEISSGDFKRSTSLPSSSISSKTLKQSGNSTSRTPLVAEPSTQSSNSEKQTTSNRSSGLEKSLPSNASFGSDKAPTPVNQSLASTKTSRPRPRGRSPSAPVGRITSQLPKAGKRSRNSSPSPVVKKGSNSGIKDEKPKKSQFTKGKGKGKEGGKKGKKAKAPKDEDDDQGSEPSSQTHIEVEATLLEHVLPGLSENQKNKRIESLIDDLGKACDPYTKEFSDLYEERYEADFQRYEYRDRSPSPKDDYIDRSPKSYDDSPSPKDDYIDRSLKSYDDMLDYKEDMDSYQDLSYKKKKHKSSSREKCRLPPPLEVLMGSNCDRFQNTGCDSSPLPFLQWVEKNYPPEYIVPLVKTMLRLPQKARNHIINKLKTVLGPDCTLDDLWRISSEKVIPQATSTSSVYEIESNEDAESVTITASKPLRTEEDDEDDQEPPTYSSIYLNKESKSYQDTSRACLGNADPFTTLNVGLKEGNGEANSQFEESNQFRNELSENIDIRAEINPGANPCPQEIDPSGDELVASVLSAHIRADINQGANPGPQDFDPGANPYPQDIDPGANPYPQDIDPSENELVPAVLSTGINSGANTRLEEVAPGANPYPEATDPSEDEQVASVLSTGIRADINPDANQYPEEIAQSANELVASVLSPGVRAEINPVVNPYPEEIDPIANPYPEATDPGANPFPEAIDPSANPYPEATDPGANPFPEAIDPSANPYPEPIDPGVNDMVPSVLPAGIRTDGATVLKKIPSNLKEIVPPPSYSSTVVNSGLAEVSAPQISRGNEQKNGAMLSQNIDDNAANSYDYMKPKQDCLNPCEYADLEEKVMSVILTHAEKEKGPRKPCGNVPDISDYVPIWTNEDVTPSFENFVNESMTDTENEVSSCEKFLQKRSVLNDLAKASYQDVSPSVEQFVQEAVYSNERMITDSDNEFITASMNKFVPQAVCEDEGFDVLVTKMSPPETEDDSDIFDVKLDDTCLLSPQDDPTQDEYWLFCSKCCSLFDETHSPLFLPCMHIYCRQCINELVASDNEEERCKCPRCNASFSKKSHSFLAPWFLDRLKPCALKMRKWADLLLCHDCLNRGCKNTGISFCIQHEYFYCAHCAENHFKYPPCKGEKQPTLAVFRSTALTKEDWFSHVYCTEHKKTFSKYCQTCKQMLCKECYDTHERDPIKDPGDKMVEQWENYMSEQRAHKYISLKKLVQRYQAGMDYYLKRKIPEALEYIDTLKESLKIRKKYLLYRYPKCDLKEGESEVEDVRSILLRKTHKARAMVNTMLRILFDDVDKRSYVICEDVTQNIVFQRKLRFVLDSFVEYFTIMWGLVNPGLDSDMFTGALHRRWDYFYETIKSTHNIKTSTVRVYVKGEPLVSLLNINFSRLIFKYKCMQYSVDSITENSDKSVLIAINYRNGKKKKPDKKSVTKVITKLAEEQRKWVRTIVSTCTKPTCIEYVFHNGKEYLAVVDHSRPHGRTSKSEMDIQKIIAPCKNLEETLIHRKGEYGIKLLRIDQPKITLKTKNAASVTLCKGQNKEIYYVESSLLDNVDTTLYHMDDKNVSEVVRINGEYGPKIDFPEYMCSTDDGHVFIVDTMQCLVLIVDNCGNIVSSLHDKSEPGKGPHGVASACNMVYIAFPYENKVIRCHSDGRYYDDFLTEADGCEGPVSLHCTEQYLITGQLDGCVSYYFIESKFF